MVPHAKLPRHVDGRHDAPVRRHQPEITTRIAAAQVHPAWGNTPATTERVIRWIGEAAAMGVEFVAFGETFLAGYPFWVGDTDSARFDDPAQKRAFSLYLDAAVEFHGPELRQIATAARDHRVFTYLGITECGAGRDRVAGRRSDDCHVLVRCTSTSPRFEGAARFSPPERKVR
jgi:predicted amidohydrolase